MTLVPSIDELACIVHGDCAEIAPDVFRVEDSAVVSAGRWPDDLVMAAAEACPSAAIVVHDRDTGERVYP